MRELILQYTFAATQAEQDAITLKLQALPFWME